MILVDGVFRDFLRWRARLIWALFFTVESLVISSTQLLAASFDCRAATHISDKAICYYEELSWREEAYVKAYQAVVSRGGSSADEAKRIAARQMVERRKCGGNPYCIQAALDEAIEKLDALSEIYRDSPGPGYLPSAEAGSWKQLEPLTVEELVDLWLRMNGSCRGGTTQMHIDDCTTREEVSDYLTRMRGWCYGRENEAGVDAEWHECGPGSAGAPR